MHLKNNLKFFSPIWTALFTFSQVAAAIPSFPSAVEYNRTSEAVSVIPQNVLFSLNQLPYELGSLNQIKSVETSNAEQSPFVIHLQDAHANPEAQARIQDILRWIFTQVNASAKPRPMLVALEGMAGPIHPEYLALVPEFPAANEALVKDLHEKGELSGAELFAWERFRKNETKKNRMDVSLFGAEDPQRYRENLKSYRRLLFLQNDVEEALTPLRKNLEVIQSRLLNSELRDFLKERERRKHHFIPYVSRQLTDKALEILGIDLNDRLEQIRFPNLTRFLYIHQIERNLNRQTAGAEWERLKGELENRKIRKDWIETLDSFMKQGHKNGIHFRQVLESALRSLQDKKIPFEQYPHCVLWIGHTLLSGEINAADLFQEVEVLEQAIEQKLIKSGHEKVYLEFYRHFLLFEKALHLELSRDEFEELLLVRNQLDPDMLKERLSALNRLLGEKKSGRKRIAGQWFRSFRSSVPGHSLTSFNRLSDLLNQALAFYLDARRRDQALVENTLRFAGRKSFGEPPVIVLIAGGFHTQGITRLISEKKIPHAVISPRMTKLEEGGLYHKVLRGENADISRYLKDASLNKQEALFLKGLLEQVMPVLAQKYGVGSKDLPVWMQATIQRHPVLARHIQAKVFPRAEQPFVRLNIGSDRTLHPVASKAISEILLTGSAESYFSLYDSPVSQPASGAQIPSSFNISFPDARGRAKVEMIENQAARIKNLAIRTGTLPFDPSRLSPTRPLRSETRNDEKQKDEDAKVIIRTPFIKEKMNALELIKNFMMSFSDEVRGEGLFGTGVDIYENILGRQWRDKLGPLRRGVDRAELRSTQESEGNPLLAVDDSGRTVRSEIRADKNPYVEVWENQLGIANLLTNVIGRDLKLVLGYSSLIRTDATGRQFNQEHLNSLKEILQKIAKFAQHFNRQSQTVFFRSNINPQIIATEDTPFYGAELKKKGPKPLIFLDQNVLATQADFVGISSEFEKVAQDFEANLARLDKLWETKDFNHIEKVSEDISKTVESLQRFISEKRPAGFERSLKRLGNKGAKIEGILKDEVLEPADQGVVAQAIAMGKGGIFHFWDELDSTQKRALIEQLKTIDLDEVERLYQRFIMHKEQGAAIDVTSDNILAPAVKDLTKGTAETHLAPSTVGELAFQHGEVAFLELAGGTGSRLGYKHPKIMFKASQIMKKSLARMRAEKIRSMAEEYGEPIPWIIMTSDVTHQETLAFFESHLKDEKYFGQIPIEWVKFVRQRVMPQITDDGEFILEKKDRIAVGGFGHGDARDYILGSPEILHWLQGFGVKYVGMVNVDNAFLPGAREMGYHIISAKDLKPGVEHQSVLVVEKTDPAEKVGLAVLLNGKDSMIEYNQFPPNLLHYKLAFCRFL